MKETSIQKAQYNVIMFSYFFDDILHMSDERYIHKNVEINILLF